MKNAMHEYALDVLVEILIASGQYPEMVRRKAAYEAATPGLGPLPAPAPGMKTRAEVVASAAKTPMDMLSLEEQAALKKKIDYQRLLDTSLDDYVGAVILADIRAACKSVVNTFGDLFNYAESTIQTIPGVGLEGLEILNGIRVTFGLEWRLKYPRKYLPKK